MFTIKHIEASGNEALWSGEDVWFTPAEPGSPMNTEKRAAVFMSVEGGDNPLHFETGSVYVMNDGGATVAKYHLGRYTD